MLAPLLRLPWYRTLARPLLFRLPPETAQRVTDFALAPTPIWRAAAPPAEDIAVPLDVAGMRLRNPLGLAAGLDKRCAYLESLGALGFGYVVGGTVTLRPQPGNPKPRLMRLPEQHSLINALGFPSDGAEAAADRLRRLKERPAQVFVSFAAIEDDDAEACLAILEPEADALELNVSSPNTAGLRRYLEPEALRRLLDRLNTRRQKALFVKLPPYMDERERENIFALVRVCREAGIAGITASNTVPVDEPRMATGRGGLSGRAILKETLRIVPEIRIEAGAGMAVNACGGIASAGDAIAALGAGADTVQLYSALVYEGPGLVQQIARGLTQETRNGRSIKAPSGS